MTTDKKELGAFIADPTKDVKALEYLRDRWNRFAKEIQFHHGTRLNEYGIQLINEYIHAVQLLNDILSSNMIRSMRSEIQSVEGKRYMKIIAVDENDRSSVHTFIDMRTGDILRAGTWNAPAKNGVRGHIMQSDRGMSVIDHFGARYLKGGI